MIIRNLVSFSSESMAQWVIDRANTCTGYGQRTAYRRVFPECSG